MLSNLIGQHARRAGDDNIRIDNAWHEAVVEPGRRRLNPLESARSDNVVPRYRHLGMTTEQIGRKEIRGNRLLRGDRHESIACCGLNLLNMFGFNGITQDQSWRVHQNILSGIVAISKLLSVLCRQQTRTANLFTQGFHNENGPPHSTEKEGNKPFLYRGSGSNSQRARCRRDPFEAYYGCWRNFWAKLSSYCLLFV